MNLLAFFETCENSCLSPVQCGTVEFPARGGDRMCHPRIITNYFYEDRARMTMPVFTTNSTYYSLCRICVRPADNEHYISSIAIRIDIIATLSQVNKEQ